jgi:hypothetical protein
MAKRLHALEQEIETLISQPALDGKKDDVTVDSSGSNSSMSSSNKGYRARYSELLRKYTDEMAEKDELNTKVGSLQIIILA